MKYIKEYWDYYEPKGKKWKLPLKMPDFIICLKKIGMDDHTLETWVRLHGLKSFQKIEIGSNKKDPDITHIIIEKSEKDKFTWSPISSYINQEEDNFSFKYMGELIATPEDIKEYYDEIEMKKDADNYNL